MAKTRRRGQTLIEVMVATMVAATTATAVFSVVLSAKVGGVKSDRKEAAAMAVKAAQEQLKNFVSAVPGEAAYIPNGGLMPGATPSTWALSPGLHNATFLLAQMPQLIGGPADPLPSLMYNVTNVNCGFGLGNGACKVVTFTVTYPD